MGSGPGLVTSIGSRSVRVWVEGTGSLRCTLRGNLWRKESGETRPVAVGDTVSVQWEGNDGTIEAVAPRRNCLNRPSPYGRGDKVQVIAANLDRLIVVAAVVDPPFRAGLVDRLLVKAAAEGIDPLLVLNKIDLEPDRSDLAPYEAAGVEVLATSAASGEGLDALRQHMIGSISLLVGHSGVGKSSLLNAVSPGLRQHTAEVTTHHGRGRHATTRVSLLPLAEGGWVVDSPGVREFGLEGVSVAELARLYPGFGELPDACRFNDCTHRSEPACAVLDAVESEVLEPERYLLYLGILEDIEERATR